MRHHWSQLQKTGEALLRATLVKIKGHPYGGAEYGDAVLVLFEGYERGVAGYLLTFGWALECGCLFAEEPAASFQELRENINLMRCCAMGEKLKAAPIRNLHQEQTQNMTDEEVLRWDQQRES